MTQTTQTLPAPRRYSEDFNEDLAFKTGFIEGYRAAMTSYTTKEINPQLKDRLVEIAAEFKRQCWFSAADEILRMAENFPEVEQDADPAAWVNAEKSWSQHGIAAANPYSPVYQPMSARVWRACIDEIRQQQKIT